MFQTTGARRSVVPTPNGVIAFDLGLAGAGKSILVTGGPFDAYPYTDCDVGICVRAENVPPGVDAHVPIRDFDVPQDEAQLRQVLLWAFKAAIDGRRLYVGCMGGWGRTGLFLALMAKAAGVPEPIGYVRLNYTQKAVETRDQEKFVKTFDVSDLRREINRYAWVAFFKSWAGFLFPWMKATH